MPIAILTIPFAECQETLAELDRQAEILLSETISSDKDLPPYEGQVSGWNAQVRAFLERSFSTKEHLVDFDQDVNGLSGRHSQARFPMILQERVSKIKADLKIRKTRLLNFLQLWDVLDLVRGTATDLSARKNFTMRQKLDFLLEKLFQLDDGQFHPLGILLEGNGVPYRDYSNLVEMANQLENLGYIETLGGSGAGIWGKITVQGTLRVEEKLLTYKEDYSAAPQDQLSLNEKIDWIIQELKKQSVGQEVLFNELEELKDLYGKLSKKNWGELLKGKLVDLALDRIISKETFGFIFLKIFGHELKFLS